MTVRPLERDFALRSALSLRAPIDVPEDEQMLELEEEMARRKRLYPGFVERQMMEAEEARHHIAVWQALIDDHHRAQAFYAAYRREGMTPAVKLANDPPWRGSWDGRVRELRRELALRRAAYPKWIANPTNPLTEADARRKMERLDAIHHRYWCDLEHFLPPLIVDHPDDAAELAALDAAAYLAHPLIRADFARVRDMGRWQRGFLPIDSAPVDGRALELDDRINPNTIGHWTGRRWAEGRQAPGRPLKYQPSYYREQEQAA
jgi:hypothetical protein